MIGKTDTIKGLLIHFSIIAATITILVLAFFYIYLPATTNKDETIIVPDLYESDMSVLEEMIVDRGLQYEVSDSVYDAKYPPLTILRQYPHAGEKVKEGRKIFLSVNRRMVPMIPLPEYDSKSMRHFRTILDNLDIEIEKITARKNPFPTVLEVRLNNEPVLPGQMIPKGAKVEVIVGDGDRAPIVLANLFGIPLDEALFYIKGNDLNIEEPIRWRPDLDTTGVDLFVIRQDPMPGDSVRMGQYIKLTIDSRIDSTFYYEMMIDTTTSEEGIPDNEAIPGQN